MDLLLTGGYYLFESFIKTPTGHLMSYLYLMSVFDVCLWMVCLQLAIGALNSYDYQGPSGPGPVDYNVRPESKIGVPKACCIVS